MNRDNLRDHLAKLRAQLSDAYQANPNSKRSLSDAMQDINRLMDTSSDAASAGSSAPAADASLPDRLEAIAVQFEADHPTLAASARRLVELLGEVGI